MHLQGALLLLLSLTFNLTNVLCDVRPETSFTKGNPEQNGSPAKVLLPVINVDKASEAPAKILVNANNASAINHADIKPASTQVASKFPHGSDDLMQSGALQRAFYVLLGGTLLLLIFLGFRMYRLQKGGNMPNVMVRKYGVLANRRDVEMLPLPLDEDDEDDTVFEVNNRIENHS